MGAAIFIGFGAAAAVLYGLRPTEMSRPNLLRIEALFAIQFGEVWQDAERRSAFAARISEAFGAPLTLRDARGASLGDFGGGCPKPIHHLTVRDSAEAVVGSVDVCRPPSWQAGQKVFFGALAAAAAGIWLFAGFWAHRLGRPLWALVQVTREIGTGRLEYRARLNRYRGGEVGALAASIDDMAARIEKQLRDQRELLAAVSHEIRTPLTRLRVLSEMLRSRATDGRLLDDVEREIAEIDDLTGQLLASSRLDFQALERRPLDMAELGRAALERLGLPDLLVTEGPTSVEGDATLLGRALTNLLTNANTHGGGVTALRVRGTAERVEVLVEDAGPGFEEPDLARAFEPFQHGGKSRGALGLGLSLVRRIVRAHGGDARAENRPEGGACVRFWLPRHEANAASERAS